MSDTTIILGETNPEINTDKSETKQNKPETNLINLKINENKSNYCCLNTILRTMSDTTIILPEINTDKSNKSEITQNKSETKLDKSGINGTKTRKRNGGKDGYGYSN